MHGSNAFLPGISRVGLCNASRAIGASYLDYTFGVGVLSPGVDRHFGTFHAFTVRDVVKTNLQRAKRDLWNCQLRDTFSCKLDAGRGENDVGMRRQSVRNARRASHCAAPAASAMKTAIYRTFIIT